MHVMVHMGISQSTQKAGNDLGRTLNKFHSYHALQIGFFLFNDLFM